MAFIMGNATVPASSTVRIFTVPASYCAVTFYNTNTAATVYVGTSSAGTNTNGLVCHSIPVSFQNFIGSKGGDFWATTGGAVPSSVNYIITSNF